MTAEAGPIVLDAAGTPVSALFAEPTGQPPRALVVALHGAGLTAQYFHAPAAPALSLLSAGASLGYTVLAIDRPGYGLSAAGLPKGQRLAAQAAALRGAVADFAVGHAVGAGVFLLGHSYGGMLALAAAADGLALDSPIPGLLGIDVSGIGYRYAVDSDGVPAQRAWTLHWGPLALYPPRTFRLARALTASVPPLEHDEAANWPDRFPAIAAAIDVPVRFTFAEHERWWRHEAAAIEELATLLAAPRVVIDRLPHAGHNISLGLAARTYHLRALAFFDECLTERALRHPAPAWLEAGLKESAAEGSAAEGHAAGKETAA